jgi:hypothetical protein
MTTPAFITHVGAAAFACFATVEAPKAYHAIQHRAATHHRAPIKHKRIARPVVPVCPPSGITTLAALPQTQPVAIMDADVELAPAARSTPLGTRSYSLAPPVFVGASGGNVAPPAPIAPPTPVASLPEPKTWFFMLAGFCLIGAALRGRHDRPVRGVA